MTSTTPRLLNVSLLKDFAGGITAADPRLTLYAGERQIGANDDWGGGVELLTAFSQAGAFGLNPNSRDAALLASLPVGNYTVRVETRDSTGTVLVEVYELPW
ncbi:MAG: hypothetical protein ACO3JJ_15725 [Opitutaceae bacterium]